jgi:transposase-like protein
MIRNGLDVLLAFFDFPGEHWIHLRTTNPIESTFAPALRSWQPARTFGRAAVDVNTLGAEIASSAHDFGP